MVPLQPYSQSQAWRQQYILGHPNSATHLLLRDWRTMWGLPGGTPLPRQPRAAASAASCATKAASCSGPVHCGPDSTEGAGPGLTGLLLLVVAVVAVDADSVLLLPELQVL